MHNVCKLSKPKSTNIFETQGDENVDNRIHLTGKDPKNLELLTFCSCLLLLELKNCYKTELKAIITMETLIQLQFGGLMGLCLGFSFLSFVEVVYWLTYRAARNIRT